MFQHEETCLNNSFTLTQFPRLLIMLHYLVVSFFFKGIWFRSPSACRNTPAGQSNMQTTAAETHRYTEVIMPIGDRHTTMGRL